MTPRARGTAQRRARAALDVAAAGAAPLLLGG